MSDPLVEEGWLAPVDRGPRREHVFAVVGIALLAVVSWLALVDAPGRQGDSALRVTKLEVNERGRAADTDAATDLPTQVRSARGIDYLVVRARVTKDKDRIDVQLPAGVDTERVTLRVRGAAGTAKVTRDLPGLIRAEVEREHQAGDLDVLLTIPAQLLSLPAADREPAGSLSEVTGPFDADIRDEADERRRMERLRDLRVWIVPGVLVLAAALPLLLWRRAARRFFSMRRPGPGTDTEGVPPSSLDPVGAAVLMAGAAAVDGDAAFAGHVVDLVERRQLLARRTMDVDPGAGVLIGLGHVDEQDDDPAVAALRSIAIHDGLTAPLPDARAKRRRASEDARDAWHLHVAARARFEAMVDRVDARRIWMPAGALAIVALVAFAAGAATDLDGQRAQRWLVAAAALPAAVVLALWARDAARWRIVTRARRNERAQWIAWRAALGAGGAATLDPRSLAVLAATGTDLPGVRTFAGPEAVGLDAVTATTIDALRSVVADVAP